VLPCPEAKLQATAICWIPLRCYPSWNESYLNRKGVHFEMILDVFEEVGREELDPPASVLGGRWFSIAIC